MRTDFFGMGSALQNGKYFSREVRRGLAVLRHGKGAVQHDPPDPVVVLMPGFAGRGSIALVSMWVYPAAISSASNAR